MKFLLNLIGVAGFIGGVGLVIVAYSLPASLRNDMFQWGSIVMLGGIVTLQAGSKKDS